jgi:hypothetical protein
MVDRLIPREKFPPVKNKIIPLNFDVQRFPRGFDEIITDFDAAWAALL